MFKKFSKILCLGLASLTLAANSFGLVTNKVLSIDTKDTSLIMRADESGMLVTEYYGKKLSDVSAFLKRKDYIRPDAARRYSFPTRGGRNFKEPALSVIHPDGDMNADLVVESAKRDGDEKIVRTEILLKDVKKKFYLKLIFKAYIEENVITQSATITNMQDGSVELCNAYSFYLPIYSSQYWLTHFHGAWAREASMDETRLTHGIKTLQSRKLVRTTHSENPSFLLSLDGPLSENGGEVIAGALAWSGDYRLTFEVDEYDVLGMGAGILPGKYILKSGEVFETPEMIFTYSPEGAGLASRQLHDWARAHRVYAPDQIRPTLLNSWEGAYFTFDEDTLFNMMDDAADLGLEMFVLDDGWFGNKYPRNSNRAGLGDWQVNKAKLPLGIANLADYAHSKNLKFGIWIEPEMVNPDSELASAHPDWIVGVDGRPATLMRNQRLLDLSNPEVQDFVFGIFDSVMQSSDKISYVKWDANRHLEGLGSAHLGVEQYKFYRAYVKGLYRVYERIREKYPHVIIQACASGGGRVEYGALKYHQEVWTSDNTDPLSRIYIQYGTNMIYPALVTGSHVSASPNHQTGNLSSLKFRFDVAMSGRLGMELQPKDMSDAEKNFARRAIADYKRLREVINKGDLYRIRSPYEDTGSAALMYVSKDKKKAVFFAYNIDYKGRTVKEQFRLEGLDYEKHYKLVEINTEGASKAWENGEILSGEFLINVGINPDISKRQQSAVFEITEVSPPTKKPEQAKVDEPKARSTPPPPPSAKPTSPHPNIGGIRRTGPIIITDGKGNKTVINPRHPRRGIIKRH